MKYFGLITIKDVEYSCYNVPRWYSSYDEDNDYSYEDYGYPSPDYHELKESSREVVIKTFFVCKEWGNGAFDTIKECEEALYKQINLLEETEEFAKYYFDLDVLSQGVMQLLPDDIECLYSEGIASEIKYSETKDTVDVELTPVLGKIMRLKHDGRDVPEDLYEAWKYICESKSIRHVWNEPDDYLFQISDAIEGLERLGYITIEYMEEI